MLLRSRITDLLNPIVWNIPGNAAKKFFRFSLAEYSSVLDLTLAANHTTSTNRSAQYLHHLQDELKHTSIFFNQANKLRVKNNAKPYYWVAPDYEHLFKRLGEKRFLAFVHHGEKTGCMQFSSYAKYFAAKGDTHTSSVFTTVLADETHHMNYTWDLLVELCGSVGEAKKEVRKAMLWEGYRNWLRTGRQLTSKLFIVLVYSGYPFLWPYKFFAKAKPQQTATGWSGE